MGNVNESCREALVRMVQAVRQVARRTAGIERVELLYSQERPRPAFA